MPLVQLNQKRTTLVQPCQNGTQIQDITELLKWIQILAILSLFLQVHLNVHLLWIAKLKGVGSFI